ncbi:MAG TPA: DUF2784 domain-containing protein [Nitrospiraceae bacterium]|jgi:hypothetical protein
MTLLADMVLIAHFLFVAFVVGGLAVIWIGAALRWTWIRNFWFRAAHLVAIGFVVAESLVGILCPLTVLEDALRQGGGPQSGFIQRWVSRLLYYDLPEQIFTVVYVVFGLIVLLTFIYIRPDRRAYPTGRPGPPV